LSRRHLQEVVADIVIKFHDVVDRLDVGFLAALDNLAKDTQ